MKLESKPIRTLAGVMAFVAFSACQSVLTKQEPIPDQSQPTKGAPAPQQPQPTFKIPTMPAPPQGKYPTPGIPLPPGAEPIENSKNL